MVALMNKVGRLTMVKAALIYLMIAMDLPKWIIKEIGKITRGFLWEGRKKLMVMIVWFLGPVFACRFNMEA